MEITEKEVEWIREFFKAKFNATEAARRVYGGTPGSCRVKGHKKLKKLEPILKDIYEKEFHKMSYQDVSGVDFYLGDLERRREEGEKWDQFMKVIVKSRGRI